MFDLFEIYQFSGHLFPAIPSFKYHHYHLVKLIMLPAKAISQLKKKKPPYSPNWRTIIIINISCNCIK